MDRLWSVYDNGNRVYMNLVEKSDHYYWPRPGGGFVTKAEIQRRGWDIRKQTGRVVVGKGIEL